MKTKLTIILLCILCSTTGFAQQYGWVNIGGNLPSSKGTASLSDLYFISDNEGWICSSAHGEIYHTTDGGQTFETQTTQFYTNAIYMLNSQVGYAGGNQGRVYKTTNGGADWIVHGSIGGTLLDIDFPPNSESGYCCGENGKIYKITSAGINAMSSRVISNLRSISFPTSTNGWTCGDSFILKYENEIWNQQDPPVDAFNDIFMISDLIGWAVGALGVIVKTENGGDSSQWNYQTNPDASKRALNVVFFLNTSEGWAVGNGGVILHTTNGGKLWTIEGAGLTTNMLRAVQFTSSKNGYVLGNNGTLLKFGLLTDVEELPTHPTKLTLEQNYPNPFKETTTIDFLLEAPSHVVLEVFSISGEKIFTLANEQKSPGKYSMPFHANDLPAGIYYYRLQTETGTSVRKMTLIK